MLNGQVNLSGVRLLETSHISPPMSAAGLPPGKALSNLARASMLFCTDRIWHLPYHACSQVKFFDNVSGNSVTAFEAKTTGAVEALGAIKAPVSLLGCSLNVVALQMYSAMAFSHKQQRPRPAQCERCCLPGVHQIVNARGLTAVAPLRNSLLQAASFGQLSIFNQNGTTAAISQEVRSFFPSLTQR